jgi:dCTP deaminase
MVLSNTKIRSKLEENKLFIGISDTEKYPVDKMKFDTTSLDLHLGSEFKIWKPCLAGEESIFDPSNPAFTLDDMAKIYLSDAHLDEDGSYVLKSNQFVLGITKEYIKLPIDLAARIEGRSKLGRLGVGIHVTAPTIHAAFEGTITLEIYNHSPRSVRLRPWKSVDDPGLRVGQLIFEEVQGAVEANKEATFIGQKKALGPK